MKNPLGAVVIGILMVGGSTWGLWWNEGNAVAEYTTIADLEKRTVPGSIDKVNPSLDGKPVYLTGKADTKDTLTLPDFGISQVALRLKQEVEMYQWDEKYEGNDKPATYSKKWSSSGIDSGSFKNSGYQNPAFPNHLAKAPVNAQNVPFGAYRLPEFLVEKVDNFALLDPTIAKPQDAGFKPNGSYLYKGANPSAPEVGDVRVQLFAAYPAEVSLISLQKGNTFVNFISEKTGRSKDLLLVGRHTQEQLIQHARTQVRIFTWIIRAVGFVVMFFGILIMASPVSQVLSYVPVLGNVVNAGIGLLAFVGAGTVSLTTITIAWFAHRPVLGIGLLAVVAVLIFVLVRSANKKAAGASS